MKVEWRVRDGADAIVLVDPSAESVAAFARPGENELKAYLAVAGNLERWRDSISWQAAAGETRDPTFWGQLVLSRDDDGDVLYIDPELFWDGVYRWFRSRGVDYNS
jgi:hypothetical protein